MSLTTIQLHTGYLTDWLTLCGRIINTKVTRTRTITTTTNTELVVYKAGGKRSATPSIKFLMGDTGRWGVSIWNAKNGDIYISNINDKEVWNSSDTVPVRFQSHIKEGVGVLNLIQYIQDFGWSLIVASE